MRAAQYAFRAAHLLGAAALVVSSWLKAELEAWLAVQWR